MSYRYGNSFQRTTPAVLNLIIINSLLFLAQLLTGNLEDGSRINDLFALHHYKSDEFRIYQVITHMFMHASILHLVFNMFSLWMFGSLVERIWGPKKFLFFYFLCGLGAALVQLASYAYNFYPVDHMTLSIEDMDAYQSILRRNATVGASGAIMGVLAAFGYLFPNTEMIMFPIPVPIKAKWAVLGFIAISIFSGIAGRPGDNIAHFAHVGGALTGFIIVLIWNKTNKKTFY